MHPGAHAILNAQLSWRRTSRPFVPPSELQLQGLPQFHHLPGAPTFHGLKGDVSASIGIQKGDALIKSVASTTGVTFAKARTTTLPTVLHDTRSINTNFPLPGGIVSPVNKYRLSQLLSSHPDKELVQYINKGFSDGFDIMYCGNITSTLPKNLKSASNFEQKVTAAITKEMERGRTSGPFERSPFHITHCSPLGAVVKTDSSVRIILDLSQPRGAAVNESGRFWGWSSSDQCLDHVV